MEIVKEEQRRRFEKHGTYYLPVPPAAVRSVRLLRRIVRSQTLAQITTQLIYGASPTVRKWTAQHSLHCMGFGSCRPTRVSLFNARHMAARLAREYRDCRVEDWK
ncbi:HTH_Tnp_Tc3_2 domain-containing protein [Trichonephila clavipes]|nr:HTH_Tnp_Tc3_2 domain-containing protein [Trichonephila clavipes]